MFIGRKAELEKLEKLYAKPSFQMAVVYGRRRVGKTTLLSQFAKGKRALSFTAQEQSNADNLADFTREVQRFFGTPLTGSFRSWTDALDYLADRAVDEPFLFIFDEFPYAAQADGSLPSKLQIAIDHKLGATGMFLILCGSNQGFMESDVLGKKSPLHGRRTAQMKIAPFGHRDAAEMLGCPSEEDAFRYYACIGGTPYYLAQVDTTAPFEENIEALFFDTAGFLYEEPLMLLRQELREPALYNSLLRAIASGANRLSLIADRAGVEATSAAKYLRVLVDIGLAERTVPFGENPQTSKKGVYRLREACYDYWYRFVAPYESDVEAGAGRAVFDSIPQGSLETFLGARFERLCCEWLLEQAVKGELPLPATSVGSWWGNDPQKREQTDIDCLAANRAARKLLIGECQWRDEFDESQALEGLVAKKLLVPHYEADWFWLFSKRPVAKATAERHRRNASARFVSLEDLYA